MEDMFKFELKQRHVIFQLVDLTNLYRDRHGEKR